MKNIAIFVSGGGTDMQSVIDAVNAGKINGKIKLIVANKDNIYSLQRAKNEGIPSKVYKVKDYDSIEKRDEAILNDLITNKIDLVVLAGYLSIVTPIIVDKFRDRIINIHPSLIPKFCGKGFYGLKVHEAVINAHEVESGCTVHYVDEGADTGKIIEQVKVPVYPTDTAEILQQRILKEEHILLPKVVAELCKE